MRTILVPLAMAALVGPGGGVSLSKSTALASKSKLKFPIPIIRKIDGPGELPPSIERNWLAAILEGDREESARLENLALRKESRFKS